jgi:hypothetical protein
MQRDMGLDLLMNPKKKGSDASSISSIQSERVYRPTAPRSEISYAGESDKMSVRSSIKSVKVKPSVINVADHMGAYETESDSGSYSESYVSEKPKARPSKPVLSVTDDDDDNSQIESVGIDSLMKEQRRQKRHLSDEDILLMKRELLYQFERLEKKGMKLPKKFTLASSLDEMKAEYDRLKRDKEVDSSVKLQRRIMMAAVSGIEWTNSKFDPLGVKLDGWSDSVYENIDDYDEIFEDLYEKYKGKAQLAPELKLLLMIGGSAFLHHMTQSMFKNQLPGLDEILKQNPELAKNLAAATSQHMANQQQSAGNLFGSLGNMFSGFFGGGGGTNGATAGLAGLFGGANSNPVRNNVREPVNVSIPMPYQTRPQNQNSKISMRGPSNVDDLLREFETASNIDNDRIEMLSVITESELQDLDDGSSSINGILMNSNKNKNKKNRITLDI